MAAAKATISLDDKVLALADGAAKSRGQTRSGYLAELVRKDNNVPQSTGSGRISQVKIPAERRITISLKGTQQQIDSNPLAPLVERIGRGGQAHGYDSPIPSCGESGIIELGDGLTVSWAVENFAEEELPI